jgi:DNA-binding SARP family transcriptional activator
MAAIEAPGGYGKSTLVQLVRERDGGVAVGCSLAGPTGSAALRSALAAAARRIGLVGPAEAMGAPDASAADVAKLIADRDGSVRFVVDEVQLVDETGAEWLVELAASLPANGALVVSGRRLPGAVVRAVRSGAAVLIAEADLAFDVEEVAALIEGLAPGAPLDPALADDIHAVTGGWPAAVTTAVSAALSGRLRPAMGDGPTTMALGGGGALMRMLVHRLVDGVGPDDRRRLASLAELPVLDVASAEIVAGPGALDLVRDVGIPLAGTADGWWRLADPVRGVLSEGAQLGLADRRAVAEYLAARGHLALGVSLLQRVDDHAGVAEVLSRRSWRELREFGLVPLDLVLSAMPDEVVADFLEVMLAAARAAELTDPSRRAAWLERAAALAGGRGDDVAGRAITVEQGRDAVRRGDLDLAVQLADQVLSTVTGAEAATRARALVCLAHVDTVRATPADLALARSRLEEAIVRLRSLGDADWEADALLRLGYAVSFQGGHLERAVEQLEQCLALLPEPGRDRGTVLSHFAEVLGAVGRADEAEAMAREGMAIGRRIGDSWVVAACAWSAMLVAAHRGHLAATRWWIEQVESSPGAWLDVGAGAEFLLDAADVLAALGDEDLARTYHERARARTEHLGIPEALLAVTARIESTFGDPELAEQILAAIDGGRFAVLRTRWLRHLLRAQAAERRGDRTTAQGHVDAAVRELDRLGDPELLWRTEPRLAQRLAHLLPRSARPDDATWRLTLLGGWRVEANGRDCTPPQGRPSQLLKWLALRGPAVADEAIEMLWPEIDPLLGRNRLRNLLHRLRARSGEVIVRHEESLSLASGVTVDVDQFDELARAALSASGERRVGLARRALAMHGGELLVSDVYEAWTVAPRERLRRLRLALVDLVAADALERGDLDEALALLDIAISLEPLDERRYLLAADALVRQGRRRRACALLDHAVDQFDRAGLLPGEALASTAHALRHRPS